MTISGLKEQTSTDDLMKLHSSNVITELGINNEESILKIESIFLSIKARIDKVFKTPSIPINQKKELFIEDHHHFEKILGNDNEDKLLQEQLSNYINSYLEIKVNEIIEERGDKSYKQSISPVKIHTLDINKKLLVFLYELDDYNESALGLIDTVNAIRISSSENKLKFLEQSEKEITELLEKIYNTINKILDIFSKYNFGIEKENLYNLFNEKLELLGPNNGKCEELLVLIRNEIKKRTFPETDLAISEKQEIIKLKLIKTNKFDTLTNKNEILELLLKLYKPKFKGEANKLIEQFLSLIVLYTNNEYNDNGEIRKPNDLIKYIPDFLITINDDSVNNEAKLLLIRLIQVKTDSAIYLKHRKIFSDLGFNIEEFSAEEIYYIDMFNNEFPISVINDYVNHFKSNGLDKFEENMELISRLITESFFNDLRLASSTYIFIGTYIKGYCKKKILETI